MDTKIIAGLPEADYHALDMMSASRLKVLERGCPAHLTHHLASAKETDAMRVGSALHCMVLTPDLYDSRYIVAPKCDRRTNAGKAEYADFLNAANGRTVLDADDAERVRGMAYAIREHADASTLLDLCPERELSVLGEVEGIPTKMRLDARGPNQTVDIKTIGKEASPINCERYCAEYGVWLQMALYKRLMGVHSGAAIIFVESAPPHCVAVRVLANVDLECYDRRLTRTIAKYREWMKNPHAGWPSCDPIKIPRWLENEMMDEENTNDRT